jgi:excisionase family DNA binding protein
VSEEGLAFDPETAGRKIGLGRTRVFEEIKAGRLKARKIGRKTVIRKEDLQAYVDALPEREVGGEKRTRGAKRII